MPLRGLRERFGQGNWKKIVKYLCIAAIVIVGLFSVIATDSGGGGGTTGGTTGGGVEGTGK